MGNVSSSPSRHLRHRVSTLTLAAATLALVSVSGVGTARAETRQKTVLLIGDSNIFGHLGKALEADLVAEGYRVVRRGKPTSGLARPDFFDWFMEARRLVDTTRPDTVVMLFGGNDGQRLRFRDRALGTIFWEDEARWNVVYETRIRRLMEYLQADGRRVVLLSPTNRASQRARMRMGRVRAAMQRAVRDLDRVAYVDMFPFSSDESGRWLQKGHDERGRPVAYRKGDGIHLTTAGGVEVARRMLPTLNRVL